MENIIKNSQSPEKDIGAFVAVYKGRSISPITTVILSFVLIIAVVIPLYTSLWIIGYSYANFGFSAAFSKAQSWLFIPIIFFIITSICFILLMRKNYPIIFLHTKGFHIQSSIVNKRSVTWNGISGISDDYVQKDFLGIFHKYYYSTKIYLLHRKPIHLKCSINNLEYFTDAVKSNIAPLLLPKFRSKYYSGKLIDFGSISIQGDNIIITANKYKLQEHLITFSTLKKINVRNGNLVILEKNSKQVHNIPISDIINLSLFLQLLDEITK